MASDNNLLCWLTAVERLARVIIVIRTSTEPGRGRFIGQQVLKIVKVYEITRRTFDRGNKGAEVFVNNMLINWAGTVRKQINRPNPKRDAGTNCPQLLPTRSPLSPATGPAFVYTADLWIEDIGLLRSLLPGYLSEAGINPSMTGSFLQGFDSIVQQILSEIRRASQ